MSISRNYSYPSLKSLLTRSFSWWEFSPLSLATRTVDPKFLSSRVSQAAEKFILNVFLFLVMKLTNQIRKKSRSTENLTLLKIAIKQDWDKECELGIKVPAKKSYSGEEKNNKISYMTSTGFFNILLWAKMLGRSGIW